MIDSSHVPIVRRSTGLRNKGPCDTAEGLYVVAEFVGKKLQGDVATQLELHPCGNTPESFCKMSSPSSSIKSGVDTFGNGTSHA
jgi:hypothetical protein